MKLLTDYSHIRGVCHNWESGDEAQLRRELGYARRLQINSIRTWTGCFPHRGEGRAQWQENVEKARRFVQICREYDISVMPIVFGGLPQGDDKLDEKMWPEYEAYITLLVNALKDEPNIIMWDVMNEPTCNNYYRSSDPRFTPDCVPGELERKSEKIWNFLHHFCAFVRGLAPQVPLTIGHTFPRDCEPTVMDVDVISFHDYLETRQRIEDAYAIADRLREQYHKPLINSELCCIGRSNPYDLAIEICLEHGCGMYVFELMIHDYWDDVHGLVYPDGTIRDPSAVAAMFGFFRNKGPSRVKYNPNKEGYVPVALEELRKALTDETVLFGGKRASTDGILEAAEFIANMLESSEMVPMFDPPTAKIQYWRSLPEAQRDQEEIRDLAWSLAETIKKYCHIV